MARKEIKAKQEAQIVEEHGLIYLDNVSKSYSTARWHSRPQDVPGGWH